MRSTADETAVGIGPSADDGVAITMPFPGPAAPRTPDRRPPGGPSREPAAPVIDRFPVLRPIGLGGMGEVFLCRHPVTGLEVAVKRLRPELVVDRQSVQRFLTEARHMYHMSHPHVLRIMEVWDPPAGPYYVMPYMPAGSLADRVPAGQPLEYAQTVRAARDVADALAFAHAKGIIHRDLKPANVLLDAGGRSHVSDFGLVRAFDTNDSIEDVGQSQCVGTPAFMSPAVARGEAEDTRCDIYSLGAMLYQLLTGHPPYTGPTAAAVLAEVLRSPPRPILAHNPHAHPGLVRVAEGCMARALRDRYATMADVLADLERVAADRPPCGPHGAEPTTVILPAQAPAHPREPVPAAGAATTDAPPTKRIDPSPRRGASSLPSASGSARARRRRAKIAAAIVLGAGVAFGDMAWRFRGAPDARRAAVPAIPVRTDDNEVAWRVDGAPFAHWFHFTPDSRNMAVGWSRTLRDAESGKPVGPDLGSIRALSSDGKLATIFQQGMGLGVRATDTGRLLCTIPHLGQFSTEAFSPDGRLLAVCTAGQVQLWDLTNRATAPLSIDTLPAEAPDAAVLSFSPDGRRLLMACDAAADQPSVFVWNAADLKRIWAKPVPHYSCHAAEFSPDGSRVLAADWQDAVLFDAADGSVLAKLPAPDAGSRRDVLPTFSPDGRSVLVYWADGGPLDLYDGTTGQPADRFRDFQQTVTAAAWSPDGTRVLAGCDGSARLLDVASGHEVTSFLVTGRVVSLAFRPDGRAAAVGTGDGMVRLFRLPESATPPAKGTPLEQ